jgi:hypothetical protein
MPCRVRIKRERAGDPGQALGVKVGDLVLLPHLPRRGTWSLVRVAGPVIWEMSVETQLLSGWAALLAGRQPSQVVAVTVNPRKFSTPPDTFQ